MLSPLPHTPKFQSTLPLRGATDMFVGLDGFFALFQSTLPLRGATGLGGAFASPEQFQSTLPLRGATRPKTV